VENLFAQQEEARFIKILPGTWEGQWEGKWEDGGRGADVRLGISGAQGKSSLSYRVLSDGVSGQAWLQLGCSVNHSTVQGYRKTPGQIQSEGRWASLDAKIGEVPYGSAVSQRQAFMSVRGMDTSAATAMLKNSHGTKQIPCARSKTGDYADGRSSVEITLQVAVLLTLQMINVVTTQNWYGQVMLVDCSLMRIMGG
jgi:hypothetical protein